MPASYLHGVETVEVKKGAVTVKVPKTAVIGLVGTAPLGTVNKLEWVRSDKDASAFGEQVQGFSIPQALDAILDHGAANVLVINVCDPATHKTAIVAEARTFAENKIQLSKFPVVGAITIKSADGATTYQTTDYVLDASTGEIKRTAASTIPAAGAVKVDYSHLDPSKVTAAEIIGAVDGVTGLRSGMQLFKDAKSTFGFGIKLLIAPGFSTLNSVAAEMVAKAEQLRCFPGIDAPIGTTVNQAIAGRGAAGAINFNTSSKRARLLYPHLQVYDASTDSNRIEPYSARWAGLVAKVHQDEGYWVSESNHEILGVVGVERPITFALGDPTCEANALNEVGITTVAVGSGTGIRAWGNRTAAWPTDTGPRNFFVVQMVADIAAEAIEDAMLQFVDKPINQALIDDIRATVNGFFRTLIARGALIDGKCIFDPAENPAEEIAAGHLTFSYSLMPPTPAERLTFKQFVDINLLKGAFK